MRIFRSVWSMSTPLLRSLLALGLLLLGTGAAHAEGGSCPSGYYPVGGQGTMGCAPLPGAGSQQTQQQSAAQWESRWGAIATDGPNDALGVATDMRSKQKASKAAMRDCQSKGGVNCKIDITYDNQCAAVVVGDGAYNVGNAPTVDEAVASGVKKFRGGGFTNCRAHYTACSLPVRIR